MANEVKNVIASRKEYNIHFVKRTKVIKIKDYCGHNTSTVPFNSAAQFGIIYKGSTASRAPERFEMLVKSWLQHHCLRSSTRAKCSYHVCDSKSSVSKDKVLVIQGIHRGRLGFGKIVLKVSKMRSCCREIVLDNSQQIHRCICKNF